MPKNIGKFMVAVGAIIENTSTGKILILKRSSNADFSGDIWEYITGRMNQFEKPHDALIREIKEEAGIKVTIIKPISVFHIFRGKKLVENELIGIVYWCKTTTEDVKISSEHTCYKWVFAKEALSMVPNQSMKDDIRAFMKEKESKI